MKKVKCEEIGFEHLWEDTTPDITYATMPPSYPPRTRRCINCGKTQTEKLLQPELKEWRDSNG